MVLLPAAVHPATRVQASVPARAIPFTAAMGDLVLLAVATVVATLGRQQLTVFEPRADVVDFVSTAAVPLVLGWLGMILLVDGYAPDIFGATTEEYQRIVEASGLSAGLVGIGCFLTGFQLSRGFFLLMFGIGTPLLLLGRLVLRRFIHRAREHGHLQERVILAGDPQHVDDVADVLRRESWLGYTVLGALVAPGVGLVQTPAGILVVGDTSDAAVAVGTMEADVILFTEGAFDCSQDLRRAMWQLESSGVRTIVVPGLTYVSSERPKVRPVAGLPLVHVESTRAMNTSRWAKRSFDVCGAIALLMITAPLTLAASIAIKLDDGGPVFVRQTRIGRAGRPFGRLKFRSTVVLVDQPRLTRPGRLMRTYSLDQLPQLWNVLRGQMSLVGPRPRLPDDAEDELDAPRRLRVRPGVTGQWQVSGRSKLSSEETVRLDLFYVDNWSIVQDLVILGRTLTAVLSSRGAR